MRTVDFKFGVFFLIGLILFPSFSPAAEISASDRELLIKIQRSSIQYFLRMSDKNTGLTKDSSRPGSPASIAATGFSLAAVAIGGSRGWVNPDVAEKYITKTLRTLLHTAEQKNGFFYHFLEPTNGKRVWGSEASSIDTALLIAGALVASEYYPDTPIASMTEQIYSRVNWRWMMNNSDFICMGWKPESGFLPYYWDSYNELMILEALAIGAPKNAVPAKNWGRWLRPKDAFNNRNIVYASSGSLFTYQFSHAFIDFRELNDNGINYFENSVQATLANREYSLSFRDRFKSYSVKSWGLSASVGPGGYKAYGGKPGGGEHDGTVAPYAALSSIIFTPEESLTAARYFYNELGDKLYGMFGFKDAYNLDKAWWADEFLGIDQGITVLMLENFLNDGSIWKKIMPRSEIQKWIKKCGLAEPQQKLPDENPEPAV